MARIGNEAPQEANEAARIESDGLESGTPIVEVHGDLYSTKPNSDGIRLTVRPRKTIVDNYPPREYEEAIAPAHKEILKLAKQDRESNQSKGQGQGNQGKGQGK